MTIRERSEVVARASVEEITQLAEELKQKYPFIVERQPEKSLAMMPAQDPIHKTRFFLGEALICQAMVSINHIRGVCVLMGDDLEKVTAGAIIDAAFRAELPECEALESALGRLAEAQWGLLCKEAALIEKSSVEFTTMEGA